MNTSPVQQGEKAPRRVSFNDIGAFQALVGELSKNIKYIEKCLGVSISVKGNTVAIYGEAPNDDMSRRGCSNNCIHWPETGTRYIRWTLIKVPGCFLATRRPNSRTYCETRFSHHPGKGPSRPSPSSRGSIFKPFSLMTSCSVSARPAPEKRIWQWQWQWRRCQRRSCRRIIPGTTCC